MRDRLFVCLFCLNCIIVAQDRETALASLLAALKRDRKQKLECDRVKDELALVHEELVTLKETRDAMMARLGIVTKPA